MLENKEKKKLSWAVTGGVGHFGVRIFSDKVLENISLEAEQADSLRRNVGMKADVAGLKARSTRPVRCATGVMQFPHRFGNTR